MALDGVGRVKYNPTITDVAGTPIVGGTWISTNYFTYDEEYNELVAADTGDFIYDDTDPNNVVSKVIAIDPPRTLGDYLIIGKKGVGVWSSPLIEPDLTRAEFKLGRIEYIYDINDELVTDINGEPVYADSEWM